MPLGALFFDLDGTLLDTNDLHARAWQRALDSEGLRVPTKRILLEIGKAGDRLVPTLVGEEVEARHGEALRDTQGEAYRKILRGSDVAVFPKAQALVEACRERGLKTALVTGSDADDLDLAFERAGVEDLLDAFDAVVTGDADGDGKPAPDTLRIAAADLDLTTAQCALVGDTPYDAIAARRAGAVCLGVLTGVHSAEALHQAGARATFDDTAALLADLDAAFQQAAPVKKTFTEVHLSDLVQEALDEAWAGLSEGELPIGSVVANEAGRIVGRGHNRARGTGSRVAHAEMLALAEARGRVDDGGAAILATTVEPCVMCLGAAMAAGIDTVVYGLPSPSNGGTERVTPPADGFFPRVIGGVRAEGSRALLRRWRDRHPDDDFVQELLAD